VIVRELGVMGMYDARLMCVFGRDVTGCPTRCTVLCGDDTSKEILTKEIATLLS
jgi:hypothetical protein